MDKQEAYEIVNGIGGICATRKEADEALQTLTQKNFFNSFNFEEKKRKQKADEQLKKLGLTIDDLKR